MIVINTLTMNITVIVNITGIVLGSRLEVPAKCHSMAPRARTGKSLRLPALDDILNMTKICFFLGSHKDMYSKSSKQCVQVYKWRLFHIILHVE